MKRYYIKPNIDVYSISAPLLSDTSVITGKDGRGTGNNFANGTHFDDSEQGNGDNNSIIWDN